MHIYFQTTQSLQILKVLSLHKNDIAFLLKNNLLMIIKIQKKINIIENKVIQN
jgi:hypothetical protein